MTLASFCSAPTCRRPAPSLWANPDATRRTRSADGEPSSDTTMVSTASGGTGRVGTVRLFPSDGVRSSPHPGDGGAAGRRDGSPVETLTETPWHTVDLADLYVMQKVDGEKGLTFDQAAARRELYGPN